MTNYLTQYHESGLAQQYGHDYGALLQYAGCDVFKEPCNIHSGPEECNSNHICHWDALNYLCIDGILV